MVTESVSQAETKAAIKQGHEYELVFIINPEVADEKLDAMVESISKLITDRGGAITGVEKWGKKKLAYPIRHLLEGHYVQTRFSMKPEMCKELEANLRILEDVMRYLLIRVE